MSGFHEEYERVLPHDRRERGDLVVKSFVEGMSGPAILEHLQRVHRIAAERDDPNQDILRAARKRWLRYEAPPDGELFRRLREACPRLELGEPPLPAPAGGGLPRDRAVWHTAGGIMVHVPSFGERMTCVTAAARLCLERIRERAEEKAMRLVSAGDPGGGWQMAGRIPATDEARGPGDGQRRARNLVELEREQWPGPWDEVEVEPLVVEIRVGFGAGYLLSMVADDLGHAIAANLENWERDLKSLVLERLGQAPGGSRLPRQAILLRRFRVEVRFVLLNLVAGFDPEPQNNPISFIAAMLGIDHLAERCRQVVFNAMSFVPIEEEEEREPEVGEPEHRLIGEIPVLREVHELWQDGLDIILGTGSCIGDEHSAFRRYYRGGNEDPGGERWLCDLLEQEGVRGDFLSLPVKDKECRGMSGIRSDLRAKGLVDAHQALKYRPMTLLGHGKLAAHVAGGGDVIFVAGPCGVCDTDKSQIAKAVMCQEPRLITHLVIDRKTAEGIVGGVPQA